MPSFGHTTAPGFAAVCWENRRERARERMRRHAIRAGLCVQRDSGSIRDPELPYPVAAGDHAADGFDVKRMGRHGHKQHGDRAHE